MKVLTLTFSGTGNTVIAMNRVENALFKTGKIEISHFDATALTKSLVFNRHPETPLPAQQQAYVDSFKTELQQADVIGIGSFAYDMLPPSGCYELFNSDKLPSSLFSHIKYFFSVETCGGLPTTAPEIIYALVLQKNAEIKSLGKVGAPAPDCCYLYLPAKGRPDGWLQTSLDKFDAFGEELAKNLTSPTITVTDMKPLPIPPWETFVHTYAAMKQYDNSVRINPDVCIGCGTCERVCPYSIIELKPRPADEAPAPGGKKKSPKVAVVCFPDDCRVCARCVNYCPTRAISVPYHKTELREQYHALPAATFARAPFTPGVTTPPEKLLLKPASFGTMPSFTEMMLRSKNIFEWNGPVIPRVKLSNGIEMPQIGLGTFKIPPEETHRVVLNALLGDYKLVDTAHSYQNEREVGQALIDSPRKREEIWLTSKLWPHEYGEGKTMEAIDRMLKRMQVEYLDLILLHMPHGDYLGAWKDLEKAYEQKKVRSIGISNFDVDESLLTSFLSQVRIQPHVMQIECNPYAQRVKIRQIAKEHHIAVQAWAPLGGRDRIAKLFAEPVIAELAKKRDLLPAQLVLTWHLQHGLCPIPGTSNDAHLAFNLLSCYYKLTDEEMKQIDDMNKEERPPEHTLPSFEKFFETVKVPED